MHSGFLLSVSLDAKHIGYDADTGRVESITLIESPLARAEEDAATNCFEAVPDKARIYLVRPFTQEPNKRSQVFVDQQLVAEMAPVTYVVIDVDPGLHRIGVRTDVDAAISLRTDPGKLYYIQYSLSQFFGNYSGQLKTIDEATGQSAILTSKRALLRVESPM